MIFSFTCIESAQMHFTRADCVKGERMPFTAANDMSKLHNRYKESSFAGERRWKTSVATTRRNAHTRRVCTRFFPLSLFSPFPRSFVCKRLRRDLPQTNHEKKREEKRAVRLEGEGGKEEKSAGGFSPQKKRKKEKERKKWRRRRRRKTGRQKETTREDGRECIRAHTRPRSCNTRMTRRRARVQEKEEGLKEKRRRNVRGTEFILRAFFIVRWLRARARSSASRGERAARCSTIRLHSYIAGAVGEKETGEREKNLVPHDRTKSARARHACSPLYITFQRVYISERYRGNISTR